LARIRLHEQEWLEAVDDVVFARAVRSWIRDVPPYGDRYWIDGWNAWALALRVVVWMQQIAGRPGLVHLGPEVAPLLAEQLAFLHRNLETDIRGNHLIKDIRALLWGAACFEGIDVARWERSAKTWLVRELVVQVPRDGVHVERSPAYHLQVMGDLLDIHQVLPPGSARDQTAAALDRMAQATVATTDPEGNPLLLGDGGQHMAYRAQTLVENWQARGGRSTAPLPHTWLEDAGWAIVRPKPSDLFLFDAGPLATPALPAHGHADVLSFLWMVSGHWIFVDTGVFEYQGPRRARSRSTAAHNTVTVGEADQAELFGVFRAGRAWQVRRLDYEEREDGLRMSAEHDGYRRLPGSPVHRRTVDLRGHHLRVDDTILGGAGQPAVARLLLHPDVRVRSEGKDLHLAVGAFAGWLRASGAIRVHEAPWWPDFGVERKTRQIEIVYGATPCAGWFQVDPAPPA
jgi:uncharacterized heparinase superfamily protein